MGGNGGDGGFEAVYDFGTNTWEIIGAVWEGLFGVELIESVIKRIGVVLKNDGIAQVAFNSDKFSDGIMIIAWGGGDNNTEIRLCTSAVADFVSSSLDWERVNDGMCANIVGVFSVERLVNV